MPLSWKEMREFLYKVHCNILFCSEASLKQTPLGSDKLSAVNKKASALIRLSFWNRLRKQYIFVLEYMYQLNICHHSILTYTRIDLHENMH